MIEISIDTIAADAEAHDNLCHVQVVGGQVLPLHQNGKPLRMPSTVINFALTKEAALKLAEKIREEADGLPDESKIATAHSLEEIERLGADLSKLKG